jgi:hypothetical protein
MRTWQPDSRLDILVCGYPIERIDGNRPYGFLSGNATRAFGLANNLSLQGRNAGLVVESGCVVDPSLLISKDLQIVERPSLAQAAASSRVLLLACTNLKTLRQRVPEAIQMEHPRKWAACCFDTNDGENLSALTRGVMGICFNNQQQARSWEARRLGLPIHIQPYGVNEHSYYDTAIEPTARPTALWIGILRLPRLLERIVRFAEVNSECEVHVVSGFVFDQRKPAGAEGSMDRPYIDPNAPPVSQVRFGEIVQLWCGRPCPPNVRYRGACSGRNAELIGATDIAIGFSRRPDQTHDDSKILDYLRGGAPVFCDDGQPAYRFVHEFEHGYVMPFSAGDEALRHGFLHCMQLSSVQNRRRIAALVRDRYGWPVAARKVAAWIDVDIPPAPNPAIPRSVPETAASPAAFGPPKTRSLRLLYIPWIDGHTGSLVRLLEAAGGIEFLPLNLTDMIPGHPKAHRSEIADLGAKNPALFFRLLGQVAARLQRPANALLLTVDWCAGLRHTTQAFREAGFPTVLVPHESVFAREEFYYRDPITGEDTPAAEMALLWGGLQASIFRRRGLAPECMQVVGSPKLDLVRHYRSNVSRQDFYARWKLPGDRPVILFATQPMDCQFETAKALTAQSRAIADCIALARQRGYGLVVRLPPSRSANVLTPELLQELRVPGLAGLDGAAEGDYLAAPHDALFHADVVVSINSTMLLEASLMERPAISIGYVPCDQFWHRHGGLPLATNRNELAAELDRALSESRSLFTEEGWKWIHWAFSPGKFDGASADRILDYIAERWPMRTLPKLLF